MAIPEAIPAAIVAGVAPNVLTLTANELTSHIRILSQNRNRFKIENNIFLFANQKTLM